MERRLLCGINKSDAMPVTGASHLLAQARQSTLCYTLSYNAPYNTHGTQLSKRLLMS